MGISRPRRRIRLISAVASLPWPPLAPIHQDAANGGVGLNGDLGVLDRPGPHHLEAQTLDLGDDLLNSRPFQIVAIEGQERIPGMSIAEKTPTGLCWPCRSHKSAEP